MRNISIDEIAKNYLDNANLRIRTSDNLNSIDLDFIVFGKIEGEYWKVVFKCEGIIDFYFNKDINPDGAYDDCYLVLDTKVWNEKTNDTKGINNAPKNIIDIVWKISVFGSCNIQITCSDFKWKIDKLNKKEYESII